MHVKFIQTGDSKHRLEGDVIGIRQGRDRHQRAGHPRDVGEGRRHGADPVLRTRTGNPIVFTAGQTFIQVVPTDLKVTMTEGTPAG